MHTNYTPIRDYIRPVDERNTDSQATLLLGVSINKRFMPSVANTIGTDLTKYKVIRKNQFACSLMQVSRDEKIPIDRLADYEVAIVSPAYHVFEVTDPQELMPEYLAMWFKRSEFDREASFLGVGGVRGSMTWDDFCGMKLPVPSLDKQKAVVKAHQAITDRIALKRQLNDNLEATAETVFKYKFDAYLKNKTVLPKGWQFLTLEKVAELSAGGDRPLVFKETFTEECQIPIYSNGISDEGLYGYTNKAKIFEESVTVSARGTVGYVFLREQPYVPIVRLISVVPKKTVISAKYIYFYLKNSLMNSTGTSQQQITVPDFKKTIILVPTLNSLNDFAMICEPLFINISEIKQEIKQLIRLQTTLLSQLTSS